jgi:hypothetical protein
MPILLCRHLSPALFWIDKASAFSVQRLVLQGDIEGET